MVGRSARPAFCACSHPPLLAAACRPGPRSPSSPPPSLGPLPVATAPAGPPPFGPSTPFGRGEGTIPVKAPHAFVAPMLSVRCGPEVPPTMVDLLVHHARQVGLSLDAIEVLGSSLDFTEAFIVASEDGHGADHCRRLGLLPPADKVGKARWQAQRLFG